MATTETANTYHAITEKLPFKGEKEILETLGQLNIPSEDYFVIGGANLVPRGILRGTPDLDMLVSREAMKYLALRDGAEFHEPPLPAQQRGASNATVWVHNSLTSIPVSATDALGDGYYPMTFNSHKGQTELVQGIPCLLLDHVIESKIALQRPKDLDDLTVISHLIGGVAVDLPRPTIFHPLESS